MSHHKILFFTAALLSLPGGLFARAQETQSPQPAAKALPENIASRIPAAYRSESQKLLTITDEDLGYLQKAADDEIADWAIDGLAHKPDGADFLLQQLEKEPSPTLRSDIVDEMRSYWKSHPAAQPVLERHVTTDPDAGVSLKALEMLRVIRLDDLDDLRETRLKTAKSAGDIAALKVLGPADELWFSLKLGVALPDFLRVPPPVFSAAPPDKAIRVLAFGDFGTGSEAQIKTAAAMVAYNKTHPFDFGLTLGDNFYPRGMTSPSDPRWKTQWENLYGPMGVKFYATLGNHDWYGFTQSPAAEILYSEKSPDWRMPAPYYTFTAGEVQFFAFDTVEANEAELQWLDGELTKSTARWKIVYGHYHIFSATRGDNTELIEKLLPILEKHHVDVYLNGHDHNLQELKPVGGVHFFVSGGGGAQLYDLNPYDKSIYKQKLNGFTVLEVDHDHFKVSFIGIDGKELHQDTLTKNP